jgi:hypothetical protein
MKHRKKSNSINSLRPPRNLSVHKDKEIKDANSIAFKDESEYKAIVVKSNS